MIILVTFLLKRSRISISTKKKGHELMVQKLDSVDWSILSNFQNSSHSHCLFLAHNGSQHGVFCAAARSLELVRWEGDVKQGQVKEDTACGIICESFKIPARGDACSCTHISWPKPIYSQVYLQGCLKAQFCGCLEGYVQTALITASGIRYKKKHDEKLSEKSSILNLQYVALLQAIC